MLAAAAKPPLQPTDTDGLWIHVVPKGELPNEDAGIVQVLDDASLNTIMAEIEADKLRLGSRWPGVYGGREHCIYNEDGDGTALAWFKEFEKRGDGIWASANGLTDLGREAVANSRYKFTSFVADRKKLEPLGGNRFRVLKIDTIGFTNLANGKDLLAPITNRKTGLVLNVDSLTPRAAGHEFSKIVNRVKRENGWDFQRAWDHCRLTETVLYNSMAAPVETPRSTRAALADDPRCKFAGDALRALAEQERKITRGSFHEAWTRVCNRRQGLFALANRERPASEWETLETRAFAAFVDSRNLGPDGKLLNLDDETAAESARFAFKKAYEHLSRLEPTLTPREVWERIKAEWGQVYWPFVAVTAE